MNSHKITFIKEILVEDPDSRSSVAMAIYKDNASGALVGIDSSFMCNTDEPLYSPYNVGCVYTDCESLEKVYCDSSQGHQSSAAVFSITRDHLVSLLDMANVIGAMLDEDENVFGEEDLPVVKNGLGAISEISSHDVK